MTQNVNLPQQSMLRLDTGRAKQYLYADKPKEGFFKKVGRFFGKALSALGPIGAAVTSFIPGVGPAVAMGIYGASQLAGDLTANSYAKDAAQMQAENQQLASQGVSVPGFFDQNMSTGQAVTNFIAPDQYNSGINSAVLNRELAINSNLHNNF